MFFYIKNIEFNIVTRILLKSIFITDIYITLCSPQYSLFSLLAFIVLKSTCFPK